ncbi:hypothetical protein HID58_021022 [Brassica napus]|uniref:Uncharacterized protein n=1 Tax=Brassica napus TaxID=3708 RepID=A0ABQ8CVE7_BRANA|nr:hypothetical protein HID58_021022 [Brassica napus]
MSAQFNSHGVSIKKNEDPSPVVCNGVPHNLHNIEHQDSHDDVQPTRDKEGNPPGRESRCTTTPYDFIHNRHEQLCYATTHVTPSGGCPVHKTNDLTIEHNTNVARQKPIMNLTVIKPPASCTKLIENTVGAESITRKAHPYRGPRRSQTAPITSLEKILPETEATPAFPMSCLVRLRFSRMMGTSGAAANVETKHVEKDIHERWNEKSLNTVALCSESTGRSNFAVLSVGTIGEATEKAKVCSLPVTPCMELPGSPGIYRVLSVDNFNKSILWRFSTDSIFAARIFLVSRLSQRLPFLFKLPFSLFCDYVDNHSKEKQFATFICPRGGFTIYGSVGPEFMRSKPALHGGIGSLK